MVLGLNITQKRNEKSGYYLEHRIFRNAIRK